MENIKTDDWPQIKARLEDLLLVKPSVMDVSGGRFYADIRAALQRVKKLEDQTNENALRASKVIGDLTAELADTKKHLNYYMGRTAQAEARIQKILDVNEQRLDEIQDLKAKLARVVEAADDAYKYLYSPGFGPDTPKLPLVKVMANLESALASAKEEK